MTENETFINTVARNRLRWILQNEPSEDLVGRTVRAWNLDMDRSRLAVLRSGWLKLHELRERIDPGVRFLTRMMTFALGHEQSQWLAAVEIFLASQDKGE